MKVLDGKFHGVVVKNKDGSVVTPDQWIVFLAKDNALPATLQFYEQECRRLNAGSEQIQSVSRLRERLRQWRVDNQSKCKVADTEPGETE